MRRVAFILILFFAHFESALADPRDIETTSPDQNWAVTASWLGSGAGLEQVGYDWKLQNLKTGNIYFHDPIQKNEVIPREIGVEWSPDSHYVALTFYYGRAMQGVMVVPLAFGKPELLDPVINNFKRPIEKTLVKAEDLSAFQGYNRLLTGADSWLSNTDLSVELDMLAFLKDKAGKQQILDTTWHRTIRFDGKSFKLIDSVCDSYDKKDDPSSEITTKGDNEGNRGASAPLPQSASIVDINNDPSGTRGFGPTGNVQVLFADGHAEHWTKLRHAMLPRVSASGLVGWATFQKRDDQQFPLDGVIRICWPDGHHKDIRLAGHVADYHIGDWKFADHDSIILISAGGLHGSAPDFYRYDLASGKLLESAHALYAQQKPLPDWTHAFDN
jgi:prepilin-type processing-associated H-X9-DG protein